MANGIFSSSIFEKKKKANMDKSMMAAITSESHSASRQTVNQNPIFHDAMTLDPKIMHTILTRPQTAEGRPISAMTYSTNAKTF